MPHSQVTHPEPLDTRKWPTNAADYMLLEEIGQGGSAIVYRAVCSPFKEVVAIKCLDLEKCNSSLEDIRREAQMMSTVNHPNVVRAHCSFTKDQFLWVVMPFMAGGSCLHIMKSHHPDGLEEAVIATILRETLKALEYLHRQGHIHRDVKMMSTVNHPNVVRAHCSFTKDQFLWVVMPFMAGGSCLHIMKSHHPDGLEEAVIATILRETLKALEYLHRQGHIHRDVKAGNILIDTNGSIKLADFGVSAGMFDMGDRQRARNTFVGTPCWVPATPFLAGNILIDTNGSIKLADFGVSAGMFDMGDRQRARNTFVGTPCWMAPEVMEQLHGYDFKADIWSFGITALELAHGHAPFSRYPPMKVLLMTLQNAPPGLDYDRDKKFSKAFKEMIAVCLVKDPAKRPTADKLLKHSFFKQARSPDFIARSILTGLPPIGDRVRLLKDKDAQRLAAKKMLESEKEEISQVEYKRGVSSWNFNVDDLKKQAALIDDDEGEQKGPQRLPTVIDSEPTPAATPRPSEEDRSAATPVPGSQPSTRAASRRESDDSGWAAAAALPAAGGASTSSSTALPDGSGHGGTAAAAQLLASAAAAVVAAAAGGTDASDRSSSKIRSGPLPQGNQKPAPSKEKDQQQQQQQQYKSSSKSGPLDASKVVDDAGGGGGGHTLSAARDSRERESRRSQTGISAGAGPSGGSSSSQQDRATANGPLKEGTGGEEKKNAPPVLYKGRFHVTSGDEDVVFNLMNSLTPSDGALRVGAPGSKPGLFSRISSGSTDFLVLERQLNVFYNKEEEERIRREEAAKEDG
eukprot:jgi/Mesen1/780/ME000110S_11048